jgi:hypothetical protein
MYLNNYFVYLLCFVKIPSYINSSLYNSFLYIKLNVFNVSNNLYKVFIHNYNKCVDRNSDIENQIEIEDDYDKIENNKKYNEYEYDIKNSIKTNELFSVKENLLNNSINYHNKYDDYTEVDLNIIEPEVFFNIGQSMLKDNNSIMYKNT